VATFVPTDDWQDVPEDAILPPGLEININLETGRKQARIPNGHAAPKVEPGQDALDDAYRQQDPDMAGALDAATLDLATLADRTPPPRRYAWDPWIPARMATLLHSFGGVGKSLLGQQIATAYTLGLELFGGATQGRPALVLAGEDDRDEVWRRQLDICRRLGVRLKDVIGKLELLAVPHLDVTLAESNEAGVLTTTPMLAALRQRIERGNHGLVLLDNSAKLFAVREGDRIGVTRCVGLLSAICQHFDTTTVLVAHDNKVGDYSGSTAWENTCRSRLHLTRDDDGGIIMAMPKANYSALGKIKLRWDDWSFRAEDPACMTEGERLEAKLTARAHGEVFLRALDKLTRQGRNVSDSARASNHAPKVMLDRGLAEGLTKQQLEAAMVLLLNEGRIRANEPVGRGANRHALYGLARTAAAAEDAA
jgi:AAA domain